MTPPLNLNVHTYQLKEALWCGVVIAPFIQQILLTHLIHIQMHISHELANALSNFRLKK